MKKFIHHIRRQPEHVRRHILHVLTLVFGATLALLWIYSLGTSLANPDTGANIAQDLKPFSALKDNLVGGYNSISQPDPNADLKAQENSL